jgi:hypothetical protein
MAGAAEDGGVPTGPTLDRAEISIETADYLPVIRNKSSSVPEDVLA